MLDLSNIQDRTTLRVDALRASYLLGDTPKPQNQKPNQEQNQKLVAFKKLRFFSGFLFQKHSFACAIFTRMHDSAALTIEPGGASPGQSLLLSLSSKASNQGDGAASTITGILIDLQGM